jgi:spore photoproduct lyase
VIPYIYIEREIRDHPRVKSILLRHRRATVIECERYGEVFNPKAQNFRLQKQRPALILARKHKGLVQQAPPGYGVGGDSNYYFSHMLNCLYDCRYCFLQGMYRSANYVLFINYEDFLDEMDSFVMPGRQTWFFSGYDGDSLALEPVTGFAASILPWFEQRPDAWLELRTKSTQTGSLLSRNPLPNIVTAFSFTPEPVWKATEHRVPTVEKRARAMTQLARAGWPIALRIDPLIWHSDYEKHYSELFQQLFRHLPETMVHSVTTGTLRMPQPFFRNMERLYPEEPLFAAGLEARGKMVSYPLDREREMIAFCVQELLKYLPEEKIYTNLPEKDA